MKTKLFLLFSAVLICLISINSCKKDYPRDIPDWLKEMIKERKKECKGLGLCCGNESCWTIYEYKKNDEIFFVKRLPADGITLGVITVYSNNGQILCGPSFLSSPSSEWSVCDSILSSEKIRVVWYQEMK
jgi:hypothetical protein